MKWIFSGKLLPLSSCCLVVLVRILLLNILKYVMSVAVIVSVFLLQSKSFTYHVIFRDVFIFANQGSVNTDKYSRAIVCE